jgi:hypothetical protein
MREGNKDLQIDGLLATLQACSEIFQKERHSSVTNVKYERYGNGKN